MVSTTDIVLTKSGTQVTIFTTKIEEILQKTITKITPPVSSANWVDDGSGAKDTKIVDLLRIESKFSVDGWLVTSHGSGDTNSDVATKRTDLINKMFKAGGVIVMAWQGTNYNIMIDKLQVTQDPEDEDTVTKMKVKFTAIVGENI